jgi:hypothetical protein
MDMRFGTRSAGTLALAMVAALAVAGIALASGTSTVSFIFSPDKVPKRHYQKGSLFVHTHTAYTGSTKTDRARLYFDDDFKIRTKGIPKCDKTKISGNIDMAAAMAQCGRAKIGSGKARANVVVPGDVHACVLAFNGKRSHHKPTILLFTRAQVTGAIDCSDPKTNHNGNVTVVLEGVVKKASGDFGPLLDINHINAASGGIPLSDFRTTIKRGRYVSARCHDRNKKWNLKTKFTYTQPSSTQTVHASQKCKVKH